MARKYTIVIVLPDDYLEPNVTIEQEKEGFKSRKWLVSDTVTLAEDNTDGDIIMTVEIEDV